MAEWKRAYDLQELASRIITARPEVDHIDVDEVLFLREHEMKPKALARTYRLSEHPIGLYTTKRFAIVFYWQNCDYMTTQQLALLMLHELLHIPAIGDRLVKHDVQDFRTVLGVDLDWAMPDQEVPDILG